MENRLIDEYSSPQLKHLALPIIMSFIVILISFAIQWPYGFGWADEGLLWYSSQRTSLGDVPLRDFFSYDPGRYYWNAMFFKILDGSGLFELLFAGAIFGALGLSALLISLRRANIGKTWICLVAITLAIALGYPRHKIYEQALSLMLCAMAFYVISNPIRASRWLKFGIATGIAAVVGRNHGVYFLITAIACGIYSFNQYSSRCTFRNFYCFSIGVVIGYLPIVYCFFFVSGFQEAFIKSVLAVANWQLPLPVPFLWTIPLSTWRIVAIQPLAIGFICTLAPLFYVLILGKYLLASSAKKKSLAPQLKLVIACSLAGIPYLHQAFDRADFGHIAQGVLPAIAGSLVYSAYCWVTGYHKRLALAAALIIVALTCGAWMQSEPIIRFTQMRLDSPQSIAPIAIGGRIFMLPVADAEFLKHLTAEVNKCNIGDGEFLAAPYFPGLYAYLNIKAPYWELYYLYPRSMDTQMKHIESIRNVRLVALQPEAAVDGLDRLKLANTYGLLMSYLRAHYSQSQTQIKLPGTVFLERSDCIASPDDQ